MCLALLFLHHVVMLSGSPCQDANTMFLNFQDCELNKPISFVSTHLIATQNKLIQVPPVIGTILVTVIQNSVWSISAATSTPPLQTCQPGYGSKDSWAPKSLVVLSLTFPTGQTMAVYKDRFAYFTKGKLQVPHFGLFAILELKVAPSN